MFSVLNIVQPARSFFGRRKCTVESVLSPVRGAAPYKVINVTAGKRGIDWRKVAQAAGASAKSMLVPKDVLIPLSAGIESFVPQVLPSVILLNTVAAAECDKRSRSVLIVDRRGLLADYVIRVVPSASKITVVTDEPEKYVVTVRSIMEQYGASIRVCSQTGENERFDVAVSDEAVGGAAVCLMPSEVGDIISREGIPYEYLHLCNEKIDPFLFVCALFECSGLKAPGELTLSKV